MDHRRYIVLTGGEIEDGLLHKVLNQTGPGLILAADSGAHALLRPGSLAWAQGPILPDILVGDLDSIQAADLDFIKSQGKTLIFQFPSHKDRSDTHLALEAIKIIEKGGGQALVKAWLDYQLPNEQGTWLKALNDRPLGPARPRVDILGAGGSRLDHSLANYWLAFTFSQDLDISLWQENSYARPYQGQLNLSFEPDPAYPYFSIIPFSDLRGLTLTGFEYPLFEANINQADASLLISNQLKAGGGKLDLEAGKILVVRARD